MVKCKYGRKLSGGCKKKPGPKKSRSRKIRKKSRKCRYKRKLSGGCKKKPGPKKSRKVKRKGR